MKLKKYFLPVLAAGVILTAGIAETMAYFTTYTEAEGGYVLNLTGSSRVKEEVSNWTKHVAISSEENSAPLYVRVKAFSGMEYPLTYSDSDGKWNPGEDGFYYYSDILLAGTETSVLDVRISNIKEKAKEDDNFNVVVVYETTEVLYDEAGNPYADWTKKVTTETMKEEE